MLNHALKYLSLGLSVIPLKPKGKEPLYSWKDYQNRRATEQEVRAWWNAVPNANIGIVTGSISKIAVVDLDGIAGAQSQKELKLESTVVSLTGNGKHLWYKHPGINVENAVRIAPGMDIRGDGGYVVVSPSISPNGRRYRFVTPLLSVGALPPFPESLLVGDVLKKNSNTVIGKEESWIAKALQEMKNGNVDDTLFTVASRLRNDGYSKDDAKILLQPHADRVGASPGHLDEKIENVWNRYEPKERIRHSMQSNYGQSTNAGLVIHSPTNPDSLKQFESRSLDVSSRDVLRTGYPKLDDMLKGGLKSSRLLVIAARTGVGKTNFLLGITKSLCQSGKRVLLFSTEMPYQQIWERYIATLDNPETFRQHNFYVCDSFAPNLEKVEEAINAIKPDVFMFDHINHVSEEVRGLGEFMQGLNFLKRKYDTTGIITAQLNRAADWVDLKTGEKVTPRMSMIKGSGTIEQASSRVLLLSETRVTPEMTEIVGNLDKNDNGPKGILHFGLMNSPYRMVEL